METKCFISLFFIQNTICNQFAYCHCKVAQLIKEKSLINSIQKYFFYFILYFLLFMYLLVCVIGFLFSICTGYILPFYWFFFYYMLARQPFIGYWAYRSIGSPYAIQYANLLTILLDTECTMYCTYFYLPTCSPFATC